MVLARSTAALLLAALCWGQTEPSKPKDRVRAIKDLAKDASSTVIPQIAAYLRDPEVEVRVEAVKAIVAIGTQYSLDPLVAATKDPDVEIQIRSTDGLVNFYYPGYVKTGLSASIQRAGTTIRGRLSDTNDQAVDYFVQARPDVIAALAKLVSGGSSLEARANAARACGVLRAKAAAPEMIAALRTKDTRVIYEVLVAIQKMREPSVARDIAFLMQDLDEKVQLATIETTGLLGNKEALPQLREAHSRARNNRIRAAALAAIAMLPDPENRPLFEAGLTDKEGDVRAAAADGFARLGNRGDAERLKKAFDEEGKMRPRLSMAFAEVMLGRIELTEFSPLQYLVNTLNSASYKGVASALLSEAARRPELRATLYPVMSQRTREEKVELAGIFARSGGKDALPVLEELSKDGDLQVAQAGTRALRTLQARLP